MESYDNDVLDEGEFDSVDMEVKPSFFAFRALKKYQDCLEAEELNKGLAKAIIQIEHIESICKAANLLDDSFEEYKKNIEIDMEKELKEKEKYDDKIYIRYKYKSKILEKVMSYLFESKEISNSLEA